MLNQNQVYPKRSRRSAFFYYLSLIVFLISTINNLYQLIVWSYTATNLRLFIIGLVICVYSGIIAIMLEDRQRFTSLQIKYHKSVIKRGRNLLVCWTFMSAILMYIFVIHKHTL